MKKLLALLLAAVMVVSLAACAGTPEETTPSTDPATEPVTEPVEDTTEPSTEATTRENKLIFGTTTDITGDWTGGIVTNGATDMMISSMITRFTTQSPEYPVRETYSPSFPIRSNPALQNAETEWKIP